MGYVVVLDEFQYFHRKQLGDFCSLLQAEVDGLAARASEIPGGLIVLGSLHAEMTALLEDRAAPLFNRTTDRLELGHLDLASVLEILRVHADDEPALLLFLWNLFEGVPKFYRDAYEQGVLNAERKPLLRSLFFSSSSPLRNEADNWFLRELRGRYDMVLQYLAKHPGCSNADIEAAMAELSRARRAAPGGRLPQDPARTLSDDRAAPTDLCAAAGTQWAVLPVRQFSAGLALGAAATGVRGGLPAGGELVDQADERLAEVEGHALEDLAGQLYEERSRRGIGDFPAQ